MAIDPKDPDIIYAGTSQVPWRPWMAAEAWESIHSGMIDDSDVFSIYVDPARTHLMSLRVPAAGFTQAPIAVSRGERSPGSRIPRVEPT